MPFQPFGYRFKMASPLQPSNVKAAIRSRTKGWFDSKNGARGWIIGPFICLWLSAFDRYGPMLFGWISRDNFGTKISGRAGSDLNGLALYFLLLLPLLVFFLYETITSGEASTNQIAIVGGLILLSPLMLWWSHKDRREAEPLVRFLEDVVNPAAKSRRAGATNIKIAKSFEMDVSGEKTSEAVTGDSIYEALLATGKGDFIILASDPETHIQTLGTETGLIIEKREGSTNQHFRAVRRGGAHPLNTDAATHFSFEETWDAIAAYVSELQMPTFLEWEPMSIGTDVYAAA